MNIYYVKMLLFTILMHILVLLNNENYQNNHYNIILIPKNTQRTTIKSRLLAQTQTHNPHYHNDPELKEIIDRLNEEAIKKFQQTHEPYEQLRELVEKEGTKTVGGNGAEPMTTTEKDLLETYEEVFGKENHIMLKSGMYPNNDDRSDKSSTCECTDTDNMKLETTKGKDKYLKHLKHRCTRGICVCSVGTAFLTMIGLVAAKKAAVGAVLAVYGEAIKNCVSSSSVFYIFNNGSLIASLKAGGATCAGGAFTDLVGPVTSAATTTIFPYSIAIYVLIAISVIIIILYIWLYRRRKNSFKHECKKHLCK
ncbi:stevor PIR protein, putative [Plasmodium reichenowi]|uniref:Stevor PIR protein, putative n=1 Tax=Plasmodium reichenowi TaxID=5854 RepID=A0A2P9DCF9_PLARE|nr:stevor PIR protein, putative [Plasmodium reichenowi]